MRQVERLRYVKHSLSLRLDQRAGVIRMAEEDGHGNYSRVIQDLVEDELRRRYGRDWQAVVSIPARPVPAESAA